MPMICLIKTISSEKFGLIGGTAREMTDLSFLKQAIRHHILTEWVNDNYGDDDYDWSKIGQLNYNFKDYYDDLTDNWNFNDDRDGNWTIITITATTNLRVSISNGQSNIVLSVYRQKQIMAESTFILMSVSLSVKKKNGKSGTKCVILILNMYLR